MSTLSRLLKRVIRQAAIGLSCSRMVYACIPHKDSNRMTITSRPSDTGHRYGSDRAWPLLQEWMLDDFRQSAIPDALTTANVQILSGDTALQVLLEDKIAQLQTVNSYVTGRVRRLLEIYDSLRDGLWCTRQGVPYAKPIHPRCDPHQLGKTIKYETPPGAIAGISGAAIMLSSNSSIDSRAIAAGVAKGCGSTGSTGSRSVVGNWAIGLGVESDVGVRCRRET